MGAPERPLAKLAIESPVVVAGSEPIELTAARIEGFEVETQRIEVVCASGDRHTAAWTGVPVADLLAAAGVPDETTHVTVESLDEYRVAIPVAEALQGLLAYLKDGVPIGRENAYENRLVSGATEGARDIKGVHRIEPTTLSPSDDPETLENLFPEGDRFTAHRYDDDGEEP
jgi:DMSO/TMAO reductase YedYZ molybdopterin-dependent catalytic subunit